MKVEVGSSKPIPYLTYRRGERYLPIYKEVSLTSLVSESKDTSSKSKVSFMPSVRNLALRPPTNSAACSSRLFASPWLPGGFPNNRYERIVLSGRGGVEKRLNSGRFIVPVTRAPIVSGGRSSIPVFSILRVTLRFRDGVSKGPH